MSSANHKSLLREYAPQTQSRKGGSRPDRDPSAFHVFRALNLRQSIGEACQKPIQDCSSEAVNFAPEHWRSLPETDPGLLLRNPQICARALAKLARNLSKTAPRKPSTLRQNIGEDCQRPSQSCSSETLDLRQSIGEACQRQIQGCSSETLNLRQSISEACQKPIQERSSGTFKLRQRIREDCQIPIQGCSSETCFSLRALVVGNLNN